MLDDKSDDDPSGGVLDEAISKVAANTADGLAKFFGLICMPAASEFGLLLQDQIAAYRLRNLIRIVKKTQTLLQELESKPTGRASPRLVKEIVQEASWCEDDMIQSMWAGLLTVASGSDEASDDSLLYTDAIKRFTPFQARLINAFYGDPRCCSVRLPISVQKAGAFYPENKLIYKNEDILRVFPGSLGELILHPGRPNEDIIRSTIAHPVVVPRLRPQIDQLKVLGLVDDIQYLNNYKDGVSVYPNLKGLDLFMRGLGKSVYPLEVFIERLQNDCTVKGIDPFTHGRT